MAGLETVLGGNSTWRQLFIWGVGVEVARALLGPTLRVVEMGVNYAQPVTPLSPAELADLVVKGWMTQAEAETEALLSGIGKTRFELMVNSTGEPIPLELALFYWRRGFMPFTSKDPSELSVETAVRQGRMRDQWLKVIHDGHLTPPSTANAVEAVLRKQITRTEGLALAWFAGLGVHDLSRPTDPALADTERAFDILVNTAGIPPSPGELLQMVRRGIIPWGTLKGVDATAAPTALTYGQGFYEGDHKDKWVSAMAQLETQIPSEYYLLQMMKTGSISPTLGAELLTKYGYTAAVVSGIVHVATATQVETYKKLTESIIVKLYRDRVVPRPTAQKLLEDIGFAPTAATYVLWAVDLTISEKQVTSAITRIRALFLARKITTTVARAALAPLGVNGTAATAAVEVWTQERSLTVKLLTESQIVDAWEYTIMDTTTALDELRNIGYTPYDAWVVLSVKNKAPLTTPPSRTNSGIGTAT